MHAKLFRSGGLLAVAAVFVLLQGTTGFAAKGKGTSMTESNPSFATVDALLKDEKLNEAQVQVKLLLDRAKAEGHADAWTRALIAWTQLEVGLHGAETAVRWLHDQPWPEGTLHRVALRLYYAAALLNYQRTYGWEIRNRERVSAKGTVDLKAWTSEQIDEEIQRSYGALWNEREGLSTVPLAALERYLTPNTYPPGIRGTLRDVVTYSIADFLVDSTHWRPEQASGVYALELRTLLSMGTPGQTPPTVSLEDATVHPLRKLAAALGDLEVWHAQKGERDAALEAHLTRVRLLGQHFTRDEEQAALVADLEKRALSDRDTPWYAMAQAELAQLEEARGSRGVAHRHAQTGASAYPHSVGGQRCLSIAARLEAPNFELEGMLSDGLARRSLRVQHQNVPTLYFRAYRVDFDGLLRDARDYNLLPSSDRYQKQYARKTPDAQWTVSLPATPDLQMHATYVVPPMQRPGLYLIAVSATEGFSGTPNRILMTNLVLTDLVVVNASDGKNGFALTVLEGEHGHAVANADLELWQLDYQKGHHRVDVVRTGAEGQAHFGPPSNASYFFVARRGEALGLDLNNHYLYGRETQHAVSGALVYTDRSVYRPQQSIQWKVVLYGGPGDGSRLKVRAGEKVRVSLHDVGGQEVGTVEVTTNAFGSAAGEFSIPTGRLLGAWSLVTSAGGQHPVRVEEYKRPTFEANLKEPEHVLRLNKLATLRGEARYYFGLPVTTGQVKWRVTRAPVFPEWWGWFYAPPRAQAEVVGTGSAALEEDGSFHFSFQPRADEREKHTEISYRFNVDVDVIDEGGETRHAQRAFRLGFVAIEAALKLDAAFVPEGTTPQVHVTRADLDGTPRAGAGSFRINALEQPLHALTPSELPPLPKSSHGLTPGDALRPRWDPAPAFEQVMKAWKDGAEAAHGALSHDDRGLAELVLPKLAPGAYRIHYQTQDAFGATYQTGWEFFVSGKTTRLAVPLVLTTEQESTRVGGSARLLVHSGYAGATIFLDRYRGGVLQSRQSVQSGQVLDIPVHEEDRGGISLVAFVLQDHQLTQASADIHVPWDNKELTLSFATFRDTLLPGAKETFKVTVKSNDGHALGAGAAELLGYMYDRSLDVFTAHAPARISELYPSRLGAPRVESGLGEISAQWVSDEQYGSAPSEPSLSGDELKFPESYGIGGMGSRNGGFGRRVFQRGGAPGMMAPPSPAPMRSAVMAAPESKKKELAQDASSAMSNDKPNGQAAAPVTGPEVRSNFAESAFFAPQLLTQADGSVAFEFTVPDAVTSWNVWVHALTQDLRGASLTRQTRSVKPLLVRPYVPRFLREGDQAALKVVLNSSADHPLQGVLKFEIFDPETHENLKNAFALGKDSAGFSLLPGKSQTFTFPVRTPNRIGTVAFKVVAQAGDLSDGELRPLPILPSRVHLAQSRFVTLREGAPRELAFSELAQSDPTRINEQLVVTVDGQLFYQVLAALPYLVRYPYECTEQTLNRFVSTAIVTSLYGQYPAVAKMAATLAKREAPLETFDALDANRKLALEETPFLNRAKGGATPGEDPDLINVLKPQVAEAERTSSLAKLQKLQTSSGGFPWWPGGPPSPYMTLYLLNGFARAKEFKVAVPEAMVAGAMRYVAEHYRTEWAKHLHNDTADYEMVTFLGYVASSYPEPADASRFVTREERAAMLAYSFAHWQRHSPYLKALLALTLHRVGRSADAEKVFASVMDSSKTTPEDGTFWAREDRSWLWYNDTIESHAFALRTLMELSPRDPRREGLVQWLFLNKKLNQWKSTRATAEVLYSLTKYLEHEGQLGGKEFFSVQAGTEKQTFAFEPDRYSGKKNQLVIPGPRVAPAMSKVTVVKSGKGLGFASATWQFSTEKLPTEDHGDLFAVSRRYFKRVKGARDTSLEPLADGGKLAPGDELEVQLVIKARHAAEYVHLRDPRGAGFEPENAASRYKYDLGIAWYEEVRDSATNFFFESLPAGEYTLRYRVRASMGGTFKMGPATLQSMYAPEFTAYSAGGRLEVTP